MFGVGSDRVVGLFLMMCRILPEMSRLVRHDSIMCWVYVVTLILNFIFSPKFMLVFWLLFDVDGLGSDVSNVLI